MPRPSIVFRFILKLRVAPKIARKSRKKYKNWGLRCKRWRYAFSSHFLNLKITPQNSANSVFERRNRNLECISAFSRASLVLFPSWVPKWTRVGSQNPTKNQKLGCQKMLIKHFIFKVIFICFWWSLGRQLGSKLAPRTAQDRAQERRPGRHPRRPRDPPEA